MARQPRLQLAGKFFHIWARRVDRRLLFVDDQDYERYISLLAEVIEDFGWVLVEFCLMPNHIHLLVKLRDPNLADGMHQLHHRYAQWFNRRHARTGRLFEHRYGSKLVDDELYFVTVKDYIAKNPVGSLCDRPEDWPWSSRGLLARGRGMKWIARTEERCWPDE